MHVAASSLGKVGEVEDGRDGLRVSWSSIMAYEQGPFPTHTGVAAVGETNLYKGQKLTSDPDG